MDYMQYLRKERLPVIWCAGCGDGTATKGLLRAIDRVGLDQDRVVVVSGIGCSSRATGYLDFNTLHTTHGRPIAFATGIKLANPELTVIVITGDGDATAIGGNHFIHGARRNIDITVLLMNNFIYGMTGGQASPTTPVGMKATTAPFGAIEPPFDICRLAVAAGASYVARASAHAPVMMDRYIEAAIRKKGFSLVEVLSPCPTSFGRRNKLRTGVDLFLWQKDNSVTIKKAETLSPEDLVGKIVTGVFVDEDRPEYTEEYQHLIDRLRPRAETAAATGGGRS